MDLSAHHVPMQAGAIGRLSGIVRGSFCPLQPSFFNSVFLAVLGVFHLIFAPKNRRWTLVSFAVIVAVLLFIPYPLAAADSLIATVAVKQADDIGMTRAIQAWQDAVTNRKPLLLLIAIGGLALGAFRGKVTVRPWLALPLAEIVLH